MESAEYEQLVLESFGLCILAFMVIVALHLMSLHFAVRLFRKYVGRAGYQQAALSPDRHPHPPAMMLLFACTC